MERIAIVVAIAIAIASLSTVLAGCTSTSDAPSVSDEPSSALSLEPTPAGCTAVSQSTVDWINERVAVVDPQYKVTSAAAHRATERDHVWFVAAEINGDSIGLWATNDDVTVDPHSGLLMSVDNVASVVSDIPMGVVGMFEAGAEEARACLG